MRTANAYQLVASAAQYVRYKFRIAGCNMPWKGSRPMFTGRYIHYDQHPAPLVQYVREQHHKGCPFADAVADLLAGDIEIGVPPLLPLQQSA